MSKHNEPWRLGEENTREHRRFRFPVCGDEQTWPWLALFERQDDAALAVLRFNEYPSLVVDNIALRKRIVELEERVGELTGEPIEAPA